MKKSIRLFSKQVFGIRYERICKSIFSFIIIYMSLEVAEIKVEVAPFILFLTATAFTFGVMWQALNSANNVETLTGVMMLPFNNKEIVISYVGTLSVYSLISKTALLFAVLFSINDWNTVQIITAIFCACNACIVTVVYYAKRRYSRIFVALWIVGILTVIVGIKSPKVVLVVISISILLGISFLFKIDAYKFYCPITGNVKRKYLRHKGSIVIYLLRYLTMHKTYLINTVGMWGVACFLPFLFSQFENLNMQPLGFAILSMNTPLCILLSCDPALEQALRLLPKQKFKFCFSYCLFICTFHFSACCVYLVSWFLLKQSFDVWSILTAFTFSLQSAILSVALEWLLPIRNWKIESDLWHHPRKYIVPIIMMILAIAIGIVPVMAFVLLIVTLFESIVIFLYLRRC